MSRLSANLKASALKPRALTDVEEFKRAQDGYETEEEDEHEHNHDHAVAEETAEGEQGTRAILEKKAHDDLKKKRKPRRA